MISQSLYQLLVEATEGAEKERLIGWVSADRGKQLELDLEQFVGCFAANNSEKAEELWHFNHPYVLVIHTPTGNGFYLDREYRHIIDVSCCKGPENPTQVAGEHLCAGSNLPPWVRVESSKEFDSFWLY